jgi:hypothetical protein
MPMTAALLWLYNESKTKKDMGSISAYNFMRLLCIRGGRTVLVQGERTGGHNDRRTTTGSADREFRADGITDKDKCYTADIFSCRGSDFGGRLAVSPVFSKLRQIHTGDSREIICYIHKTDGKKKNASM